MDSLQVAQALKSPPPKHSAGLRYLPVKFDGMRLGLFLLIIMNVSRVHQAVSLLGQMRPGLLLVLLTGAYALANPKKLSTVGLFKTTEAKLIFWLFMLTCLSATLGISLGNSAKFLLDNYIKTIIAAFLLLAGIRHVQDLFTLIWAYVVGAGILSYMAIFMFKMSKFSGTEATRLSNLYTFDANDIGVVLMVGLPLALLMFQHSAGLRKWMSGIIIIAIGVTLARSGSRGALIGLILTGVVLLVSLKTVPIWKRGAFVGVVALALVLAAPPGYWAQMQTLVGLKQDYNWTSKDGRRQLILRGITYMMNYPLTGLGPHNFQRAECMSSLSDKVRTYVRGTGLRCQPPHNTYVEVGAETGITGLLLFLGILFGSIWRLRKLRRKLPKSWRIGDAEQRFMYDATLYLSVMMFGFAVTSFFVTFAWLDIIYIAAVYCAGLTISVRKRLAQDAARGALVMTPSAPLPPRGHSPVPVHVSVPVT